MKQREIEEAIEREVAEWPGASVTFAPGGKHPKAKLKVGEMMLAVSYSSTPSDYRTILNAVGDVRRTLRKLGATRTAPDPTREEDEAPYRKANDGAVMRPVPVQGEKAKPKPSVADQLVESGVVSAAQSLADDIFGEGATTVTPGPAAAAPAPRHRSYEERPAEPLTKFQRDARAIIARLEDGATDEELAALEQRIKDIIDRAAAIVDGVYFGLPDDVYHAVPRISASGLQKLCVSPATFWADSWLNPEKLIAEPDEGSTPAQVLGKAYHCARLEPERFDSAYCRQPSKDDYLGKGLLTSDTAVKAALKEAGAQQTVTGETNVERAERLLDEGFDKPIWGLIMRDFEEERAGRIPIPAKYYDQIVADMERVKENGEIHELMVGGAAEVSVFWTDRNGLKCKCRFDYLTPHFWTDLKTFDNSRGKELEQALADAMRYNRYYVQAVHYRDGAEAIRVQGLQVIGNASDAHRELIAKIQIKPGELDCWFVFQEKGGVPNLLARQFPFYDVPQAIEHGWSAGATEEGQAAAEAATRRRTGLFARGHTDILHAKDQFVLYSNAYDAGKPWFPLNARKSFSDLDFNSYWIEGKA
jgi:hypothetical protein